MKLVTVIPFQKSLHKETLTYFSNKDVRLGDIVIAPLRNKEIEGLVISVDDVFTQKTDIKDAAFQIKKIQEVRGAAQFSPAFFDACEEIKDYFAATTGQLIDTLIPAFVYSEYKKLVTPKEYTGTAKSTHESLVFQAPIEDRLVIYKSFIRESFAKKESVFFCFPTAHEAKMFYEKLHKGIEKYAIVLHPGLSAKTLTAEYNRALGEKHPVVIFGLPTLLFLPRKDIGTYIIEHESAPHYISQRKPHLDARIFAETFARTSGRRFMLADTMLRAETLWRVKEKHLTPFQPLNFRVPEKEDEEIIDMRQDKEETFSIISSKLRTAIIETVEAGEQMFLFVLRKGYAPQTVCHDCGTVLIHNNEPLVLYEDKSSGERFFQGQHSKKKYSADLVCPTCESWDLTPLGIGTETVYEALQTFVPKEKIFSIDSHETKTEAALEKTLSLFAKTKGAVLIGTERALMRLPSVHRIAVVSFDSLFFIPSPAVYQKIMDLVLTMSGKSERGLLLQTRRPEEKILTDITQRNLQKFYNDDLTHRKQFHYPPFWTIISVSYESSLHEGGDVSSYFKEVFQEYSPVIRMGRTSKRNLLVTMIIKVPEQEWSYESNHANGRNKILLQKLKTLSPGFTVRINPERL